MNKSNTNSLVRIQAVTRTYKQGTIEVHALRGVDLEIGDGEFSALAGPSGSGKTTMLNMIGVLDSPTNGKISVANTDVTNLRRGPAATFRLHNIVFIFQAYNLVPVLTAYENAEFTMLLQGASKKEREARVIPLLEQVGLKDQMHRRPFELSGGQQQRVAVVRALATRPKLILADEPTANLDSKTSAALLDMMLELNKEFGITFLFSTHDQDVIARARRVIWLDSGNIVRDEKKSEKPTLEKTN